MFNRIVIKPHSQSDSAVALVAKIRELTGQRTSALLLRPEGSRYVPRDTDLLFNYGDSRMTADFVGNAHVLNAPGNLANTTNKLSCLRLMSGAEVPTVNYTADQAVAQGWLDAGNVVYARTRLQGHSGEGIVVCSREALGDVGETQTSNVLVQAPLYTKGISGQRREYRVHVMNGVVVYSQLKRRRNNYQENPAYSNVVRNFHTGWIYSTQNMQLPANVRDAAMNAVAAAGLYFGAVDVIHNNQGAFVLEINTAPGMTGTTLDTYAHNLLRIRDGQAPAPLAVPEAEEINEGEQQEAVAELAPDFDDQADNFAEVAADVPAIQPARQRPQRAPRAAPPAPAARNMGVYRDANGALWQYRENGNYLITFGVDIRVPAPANFPEGYEVVV